jgi:hypothetical protein
MLRMLRMAGHSGETGGGLALLEPLAFLSTCSVFHFSVVLHLRWVFWVFCFCRCISYWLLVWWFAVIPFIHELLFGLFISLRK